LPLRTTPITSLNEIVPFRKRESLANPDPDRARISAQNASLMITFLRRAVSILICEIAALN